jgi:hypothetical protein
MSGVGFVFSNPRHHLEMMAPVAHELGRRGVACHLVSLAELRGFQTPPADGLDVVRAIPARVRKDPAAGAGGGRGSLARRAAQTVVWRGALGPRLRWLLRGADAVVVPNDAAYPYRELAHALHHRRVPFALLQEGIRFPLPNERRAGAAYGAGGADAVCAWGEASAEHFREVGAPSATVHVTGNPRFDAVDPAAWRARGAALLAGLGLTRAPLLYLSNPIDDQGFCSTADKLALFEGFVRGAAPALRDADRAVVVKLHPREDVAAFRAAAARAPAPTHVVDDAPIFAVLAAGAAAVVLASTVGLEALVFGLPLGVLALPGHGHVFDYVASGAAIGLGGDADAIARDVERLLAAPASSRAAAYLERHLAHRGTAAAAAADAIAAIRRPG